MDGDPPGADAPADTSPDSATDTATAGTDPNAADGASGPEAEAAGDGAETASAGSATDAAGGRPRPEASAGEVEAYTTERRTLSPRVQVAWILRVVVTAAVFAAIATVGAAQFNLDPRIGPGVGAALTAFGLVHTLLRYRLWAYEVRADTLYLQRGVFTHVRTLVPYVRIQHVDTQRGPVERALGLSTLVVYTAGSRGADVSIPGLTPAEADDLQARVKELAIEAEGGDAV